MHLLDWVVLISSLLFVTLYGVWRGRRSTTGQSYLLADRNMRWYTVLFSIMATQASAITFLSTPGQAYVDGMRFIQFYFGLPLAMIVLSITAVPIYHRLQVYTAYEYLETRFDVRTRTLAASLFLIQRGLAAGLTIYAPAIIFSTIFGWDIFWMNLVVGGVVIIYTTSGGARAVGYTQSLQMAIIFFGMAAAYFLVLRLLPPDISLADTARLAGHMGKMDFIDWTFDLKNRYNIWSGLIGGFFLQLSYFGTDQSQVQRYLTGKSVAHSRLGLLMNGLLKIPMQIFILFLGVLVFVFYQFNTPPMFFNRVEVARIQQSPAAPAYAQIKTNYETAAVEKRQHIEHLINAMHADHPESIEQAQQALNQSHEEMRAIRQQGISLMQTQHPQMDPKDTNFVFLTFITQFLPVGIVGLVIAAIVAAAMSSTAAELNALASTATVDLYRRFKREPTGDVQTVRFSRWATIFWGLFAIAFADYASRLGSLIEAVNILGSLFYGAIVGIFLTAFYMPHIGAKAVFWAAIIAEILVIACFLGTEISFLWYNVIGCMAVAGLALLIETMQKTTRQIAG
jgi:SSS family transporter